MKLFSPVKIGGLTLGNRVVKAGCFEGMSKGGVVTDALTEHHVEMAAGGVGMTTVAYCSVAKEGLVFDNELWMRDEILPQLKELVDGVHKEGAAVSIQLGHSGFFTSKKVIGQQPIGASAKWCLFHKSKCREMNLKDIDVTKKAFVDAALLAKDAGFDAIELHGGHGYLLSQFLSPWTNKRSDNYGGSLQNRMRFPMEVLETVREAVGEEYPIIVKMNMRDGMKGGVELADSLIIAKGFERAGASALVPSVGFTSKVPFLMLRGRLPINEMAANQKGWMDRVGLKLFGKWMVPFHKYESLFLREDALQVLKSVNIPVGLVGGVDSAEAVETALADGFDFVQMGRHLILEPQFVNNLRNKTPQTQTCDHCNRCVAAMDLGGVTCISKQQGFII